MSEPRLVFAQTVEGLFQKGLGESVTPTLRAKLKAAGLDLNAKLLPAYPHAQWTCFVVLAAEVLYPQLEQHSALNRLGEVLTQGFFQGTVGKALSAVVRLLGPRRTLLRTRHSFRSGNNYAEATVTQLAECHFEMWMNETGPTVYLCQGVVLTGLRTSGALLPEVAVSRHDPQGVTFEIRWSSSTPHVSAESRF